jgi:hypothetical protein
MQITPIDFANGTLKGDLSTWIGNDNTPANTETGKSRTKVEIPDPDVPTEYLGPTDVDTQSNQYISFDATSARKDVREVQTSLRFQ